MTTIIILCMYSDQDQPSGFTPLQEMREFISTQSPNMANTLDRKTAAETSISGIQE